MLALIAASDLMDDELPRLRPVERELGPEARVGARGRDRCDFPAFELEIRPAVARKRDDLDRWRGATHGNPVPAQRGPMDARAGCR